jgi:hypothetical protein
MSLNTLIKDNILQMIASQERRIEHLEALLQGQPIGTARIADAAITNAKIVSLSVDKLISGQLSVSTIVYIGDPDGGDYIEEDGGNSRILMYKDYIPKLLIGEG